MASDKGDQPALPTETEAEIANFDASKLKHAETVEKHSLPSPDVICQEKTLKNIEEYDKTKLKPTETVEKNPLPTQEAILEEKRTSVSS